MVNITDILYINLVSGGEKMRVTMKNHVYDLYNKKSNIEHEDGNKDIEKNSWEKIKEALEGTDFKTEEEKTRYENKLSQKIKLGEKLTPSEMSYIQRTNPVMYMRIKRIQMQRELLENKLKRCRSKKEVEAAYNEAISTIHKKDPDKHLLVNAYNNVTKEFKSSREYRALPEDIKDKKDEKKSRRREQQKESIEIIERARYKSSFDVTV